MSGGAALAQHAAADSRKNLRGAIEYGRVTKSEPDGLGLSWVPERERR